MANVKIKLNSAGVRELLKSPEIAAACEAAAHQVTARAGGNYEVKRYTGKRRVNVSIRAANAKTRRDNLANNTLLKALGKK